MINVDVLKNIGWYPNRDVSINEIKTLLFENGYTVDSKTEAFLKQFIGLKNENFHFDIIKTFNDFDVRWISEVYSKVLKDESLCIIGQAYNNHLTILMGSTGRVFGGYDEGLYFIGENYIEAIEKMYFNLPLEEISV